MLRQGKIRVAYADDHQIVRSGIAGIIESFGNCEVVLQTGNGRELIDQIEKMEEPPSICMLDVFMPVLDGLDTMIEIRRRWPSMRFLVLTGHYTDYYLIKMIRGGANGYLLKDCSPSELDRALISISQHGMYYTELITNQFVRSILVQEIKMPEFSEHEIEFMNWCCTDLSYVQIAEKMETSAKSVDWTRNNLFKKLKLINRSSLVMFAIQAGIIPVENDRHHLL